MVAPAMIATAVGIVLQGTAEVGERESGDGTGNAKLLRCGKKCAHGLAYLYQEVGLSAGERSLAAVRIESTKRAEEDLALEAQGCPRLNDLRDLLELPSQACGRKNGAQCGKSIQSAAEQLAIEESLGGNLAIGLNQGYAGVKGEQLLHSLRARVAVTGGISGRTGNTGVRRIAGDHGCGKCLDSIAKDRRASEGDRCGILRP